MATSGLKTLENINERLSLVTKKKLIYIEQLFKRCAIFWNRNNNGTKVTLAGVAIAVVYYYISKSNKKKKEAEQKTGKRTRLSNKKFLSELRPLLKIVLPGVRSKEFALLTLHTLFLVARTFLSIYVAKLDGIIVKSLVDRNGWMFLGSMAKWFGVAVPATYVNAMIKYLESKLSIAFRTRLSEHAYELYMENETYYRVGNLDSRLANADQSLTEDINKFCSMLAHLHSQLSKPILDVVLMSWQLLSLAKERGAGGGGVSAIIAAIAISLTAKVLKLVQPPFGKLAAEQAKLEGDLRFTHSRLITHSEEVAFYRGHTVEKKLLYDSYLALVKHMNDIFRRSIFYTMMEGFFMKYVWSAAGLTMIALPAFFFEKEKRSISSAAELISTRTQDFVTSKKLLMSGAEAIERIMLALKDVNELAGYTERVHNMLTVFKDLKNGKYQKQSVVSEDPGKRKIDMTAANGMFTLTNDLIRFEDVPIVSPNGDILVERLSFEVKRGMHLLITGPNGCGKSSLFRILSGLWPVYAGSLARPDPKDIFYIPQRPYLPIGTLRDQIIYPDSVENMKSKRMTDNDLEELLKMVSLTHILEREKGWDAVQEWKDVLSGGEKQRVAMARLFYHKPLFAILDECTSAVSIDVEGKMYQHAIDLDITLLTVTHRPTLWKYHNYLLQFDGEGGYKFTQLNADIRLSLKEEKSKLESQLAGIPKMQKRLRELCGLLGEDSVVLQQEVEESETESTTTDE